MRPLPVLLVLLALLCGAVRAEAADSGFPKLAVLRLEEIVNSSKLALASQEPTRKLKSEAEARLAEMDKEIQRMETSLQALDAKHEKAGQIYEDLQLTKFRQKQYLERMRGEIDRRLMASLNATYATLRTHLKDFCAERGIMIVAQLPPSDLNQSNLNEMRVQLSLQSVLYADPGLDITDAFLAYSNNRFASEGGKPPAAPAQPSAAPAPAEAKPQ